MTGRFSRRDLLKTTAAAGVAGLSASARAQELPAAERPGAAPAPQGAAGADETLLFFFTTEEARFVEAVVDRLIPPDEQWPGAAWAGVVTFIDQQLAGAYGSGARMYLEGPWKPDAPPQQGYQLRYSPAELYRTGIREAREWIAGRFGAEFRELAPDVQDQALSALESGTAKLPSLPSPVFFETLLANTVEGWFADPAYGGNRDMVAWRMVGFPGAFAQYVDLVELYDRPYTRPPISLANQEARRTHLKGLEHG